MYLTNDARVVLRWLGLHSRECVGVDGCDVTSSRGRSRFGGLGVRDYAERQDPLLQRERNAAAGLIVLLCIES